MKIRPLGRLRAVLSLLLVVALTTSLAAFNWASPLESLLAAPTERIDFYATYPYVAAQPGSTTLGVAPENGVQLQDLRGVECYAQPDQLSVCGAGDTIPLLLFTKSEEPIVDITLTVNFEEGLEYGLFAFANSGPAVVDEINVDNPEAPVFRISELSQAGGGVVVYIGVRAACGINLDVLNPNVTFNLDYEAGGVPCSGALTPETPYGENVVVPEVVFNAAPDPLVVEVEDINTDACTTIPLSQVTQNTAALGAILTIDEYGFDTDNIISSISVDGVPVPDGDITIDPTSGMATVILDGEANGGYFGGDGQLAFGENSNIEICFQQTESCFSDVEPVLSVVFACRGELCAGSPDFDEQLTVANAFDFNVAWNLTNVTVLETPSSCGVDGDPDPFLVSYDIASAAGDYTGDLRDLRFFIDRCATLSVDTIYYTVNGGTDTYALPTERFGQVLDPESASFGRTIIDLNNTGTANLITADPDLPGVGIEDLDGDGKFDDIAGDQTLTIFMGFTPEVDAGSLSCGGSGGVCAFTTVWLFGRRDCGTEGNNYSGAIPGDNDFTPGSTAGIGGDTMTYTYGTTDFPGGFDFLTTGRTGNMPGPPNISSSKNVEFNYNLDATEALTCTTVSGRRVVVQYSAPNRAVVTNIDLTNAAVTNGSVTELSNEVSVPDSLSRTWEFEVDPTVDLNDLTFTLTIDTNICSPRISGELAIFLLDDCDGCTDAPVIRTCETAPVSVDPDNFPECICDYETQIDLVRVNGGFTDRTLATEVTEFEDQGEFGGTVANPSDIDTLQVLPGDTVEITTKFIFINAGILNELDRINFIVGQLTANSGNDRSTLTHFFDIRNSRLMDITFQRPGDAPIDLGAVDPGDVDPVSPGGIIIGSGNRADEATGEELPQPGISHDNFIFRRGTNNNDTADDGDNLFVLFVDSPTGSVDGYSALLDAIGGSWEDNDTVTVTWQVPIISIPDLVVPGGGNPVEDQSGLQTGDVSRINATVDGRQYTDPPTTALTANLIGGSTECIERPAMQYYEPTPKVEAAIDFQPGSDLNGDGCAAFITIDYTIDNPPPAGFYPNEYRPILGIEQFDLDIPSSYFLESGTATIEVLNGGVSKTVPFTAGTADSIANDGTSYLIANPNLVTLSFLDSEKADFTNWPDYLEVEGDEIDITQVGGDLPLLGVGLGSADTLRITIPLQRICPDAPATNLNVSGAMSYPYLADYNTRVYTCNAVNNWPSVGCAANNRYFPYNRNDADNPHRFAFDAVYTVNNAPTAIAMPTAVVDQDFLIDMGGPETNTFTLTSSDAVDGGVLAIEVANAVDLQMITGDATAFNEVGTTDSSTIYQVDIGAIAAGGTFTIDLITDLTFCSDAFVNLTPVLGCASEDLTIVAALSGADCGGKTMYQYVAGQAEVTTTFDYPSNQNGCMEQTYNIQYRNSGTSELNSFFPTIYIPAGLDVDPAAWMVTTFSPGSGPTSIIAPTENTDKTGVYGMAFEWPANYFDGIAGTDVMSEGEIIIISFTATPTCDFISGLPIVAEVVLDAACERELETDPAVGPPVNVVEVPNPDEPAFEFSVTENRVSCTEGAEPITLTATNTGKAPAMMTELCFILPPGISLTADNVEAIAPVGYEPVISDPTPVGTGGATEICVTGPDSVSTGGFLCLNILPEIGDIDCGPADIGFNLKRTEEIDCNGTICEVEVLGAEALIPIEVVPGAAIGESSLVAQCSATAGMTDLAISLDLENIGGAYNDVVEFELYFDIDGSGEVEDADPLIGTATQAVTLGPGEMTTLMETFTVMEEQACPVILKAIIPGCSCGEVFIPFDPVEPDFIADIGTNFVLCPGDSAVIEDLCGTFDLALNPMAAGRAYQTNDSIVVALNEGFGVTAPVTLTITNSFGNCGMQEFEILFSQLETFEFGPYDFEVCSEGCQILDLGIPIELQEDLEIVINPGNFITDVNSFEPEICDPTNDQNYTIEFMLNGSCMAMADMTVTVAEPPSVELTAGTGCQTGFKLNSLVSVTPTDLGATVTVDGDGTFTNSTVPPSMNADFDFPAAFLSDDATYVPGPEDLEAGEVTITVRTENPDGPCGGAFVSETFTILLVDCGNFFWDGSNDD